MDERVKEIELALKNAVYLDSGSKERGPIVAFHRDDITYLLNCIQCIHELEEGIEIAKKVMEYTVFDVYLTDDKWSVYTKLKGQFIEVYLSLLNQTRKEG